MNENYDKYRHLLEANKALLVVGEVNNDEAPPKIFPAEVMLLEDAPKKYTKQVHLRLNAVHLNEQKLNEILALVGRFSGKCPLFLCIRQAGGEIVFIETHDKYFVAPSREFQKAVDDLFGEDTYYARVDTSLPEKPKRAWERKSEPAMAGD